MVQKSKTGIFIPGIVYRIKLLPEILEMHPDQFSALCQLDLVEMDTLVSEGYLDYLTLLDLLQVLMVFPSVSITWLVFGRGKPITDTREDEGALIQLEILNVKNKNLEDQLAVQELELLRTTAQRDALKEVISVLRRNAPLLSEEQIESMNHKIEEAVERVTKK